MKKQWSLIENVFDNCTKHNYLKMVVISDYTDAAIKNKLGTPFFDDLYAGYHPDQVIYDGAYDKWDSQMGFQKGSTSSVKGKLAELSNPFIGQVDRDIQDVYTKGSPRYIELLPNGRGPFQTGRIDQRIHALHSLRLAIGTDAAILPVRDMVQAFIDELDGLRSNQGGNKQERKDDSDDVENSRIIMANRMMWAYGGLVTHYYNDLEKVGTFFDQINIRNQNQLVFNRTLAPHTSKTLCRHLFHAGDQVQIKVNAPSQLRFGLTLTKNETVAFGYPGNPGSDAIIAANDLGDFANPYITVTNNTDFEGSFTFTLL